MPAPALPTAALLLGLLGLPGGPAELPAGAEVVSENLGAFVAPDATSVAPERLRKGAKVRVVDADPVSGWLTIEPPASAFSWIEETAVQGGRVSAAKTVVRTGVPNARMPGPPRAELRRGTAVRLLKRPPLIVGTGVQTKTWVAIAPPKGEVRYVRADGLSFDQIEPPRETLAAYEPEPKAADLATFPADVASEVASIEAAHKSVLSGPVEQWRLDPIRSRYEALLKRLTDPDSTTAIRARLDLVTRHESIAKSARAFETIVARSRRRDEAVAMTKRRLAELNHPQARPYVAEGLIQQSSQLVDGRRVYALIGPEGSPVAYLDVPPGLDTRPVLSKRAGVRGSVRYNEALGTRLIAVRDLEPLE